MPLKRPEKHPEIRFASKCFGTVIHFSSEVVGHFVAHRQTGKIKTEIGGQLFARFFKNDARVLRATGPSASDKRGWAWFRPDQRIQNVEIKRVFKEELHFVGDWHTHPERKPSPSSRDLESMEDCFKKSRHELKAFVMVIVGRAEFPDGLSVSLHRAENWERLAFVPPTVP
jgi:integrative and conjugative element protein (TIGR02256 family)